MNNHHIDCECYSPEHTLTFSIDKEDHIIYTSVFLNHWQSWYKRVWIAIKYIFGYKCIYGHFDCTILGEKEVAQLKNVIDEFEQM